MIGIGKVDDMIFPIPISWATTAVDPKMEHF